MRITFWKKTLTLLLAATIGFCPCMNTISFANPKLPAPSHLRNSPSTGPSRPATGPLRPGAGSRPTTYGNSAPAVQPSRPPIANSNRPTFKMPDVRSSNLHRPQVGTGQVGAIPNRGAKPIVSGSKPISGSKPVVSGSKPVVSGSKPISPTNGKLLGSAGKTGPKAPVGADKSHRPLGLSNGTKKPVTGSQVPLTKVSTNKPATKNDKTKNNSATKKPNGTSSSRPMPGKPTTADKFNNVTKLKPGSTPQRDEKRSTQDKNELKSTGTFLAGLGIGLVASALLKANQAKDRPRPDVVFVPAVGGMNGGFGGMTNGGMNGGFGGMSNDGMNGGFGGMSNDGMNGGFISSGSSAGSFGGFGDGSGGGLTNDNSMDTTADDASGFDESLESSEMDPGVNEEGQDDGFSSETDVAEFDAETGAEEATYSQAVKTAAPSYAEQGEHAFRRRDYAAAARNWKQAVAQRPDVPALNALLGQALFMTGDYREAAAANFTAMKQMPTEQWGIVVQNYRQLYGADGIADYAAQLRELRTATERQPDSVPHQFLIGYHFGFGGKKDIAKPHLERLAARESTPGVFRKLNVLLAK